MDEVEPPYRQPEPLPRTREIYRALVAHSPDALIGVNRNGAIVFWNRGAEQIFGYSSAEILGQPLTRLISVKREEPPTQVLKTLLTGHCGETALIEAEALRKDGSTFPIELSCPVERHHSELLSFVVGRDTTGRWNTERALRDSAEHYCNLFAACLEAVLAADPSSDAQVRSQAFDTLRAYCLQELTEMKAQETFSAERTERVSREIDRMLSTEEPVSDMVREMLGNDGKKILLEQHLRLVYKRSQAGGTHESRRDITEHHKTAEQLKRSFLNVARIVSRIIESCDPYTARHQQRVAKLASLVGEHLGLPEDMVDRLYLDGLLHDVGKVSIPRSILTKPGDLGQEEWALIRAHSRQGYDILKEAGFPWPIAEVALKHHERRDGSGYPDGSTGDELDMEVSILAVCDVVEAMSSHRPYRPARSTMDVLQELKCGRGTKYDASVVDCLLPMIESGELRSTWNSRNSTSTAM